MHRFLLSPQALRSDPVLLDEKESHHARNVLRVKVGEEVELLDGQGSKFRGVVAGFERGRVALSVDKRSDTAPSGVEITLAAGLIKPDRMEWMLEKCCELGVREWAPVLAERSVVKLSRERWQAKISRWKKIASETCKQCGQPRVPLVREPAPLKDWISRIGSYDLALIPTLTRQTVPLEQALASKPAGKVLLLIGPEGDFTPEEAQNAVQKGALPVSLGPLVLRAETAALFAVSAVQFFYASQAASRIKGN